MRVTVIHNESAGKADDLDLDALLSELRTQGHEPRGCCQSASELDDALQARADLILVAGGDGTVARVAKRIAGRGIPVAMLPAGTANNIAASLSIKTIPPGTLPDWKRATPRNVDLGHVIGPDGDIPFLESVGCGLFVEMMVRFDQQIESGQVDPASPEEELVHARGELREVLAAAPSCDCRVEIDGKDYSSTYLMVEVMNMPRIGPRVCLTDADPGDGLLDVVLVADADRPMLDDFLKQPPSRSAGPPPGLRVVRGKKVHLDATDQRIHIDDKPRPDPKEPPAPQGMLQLTLEPGALTFLIL